MLFYFISDNLPVNYIVDSKTINKLSDSIVDVHNLIFKDSNYENIVYVSSKTWDTL